MASGIRFTLGSRSHSLRESDFWRSLYLEEDAATKDLRAFDKFKARYIDFLLLALSQVYWAVLAG